MEDERGHSVRIHAKLSKELNKFNKLSALINEQKHLISENLELTEQLAMSKPLVTSMLEFLSAKSTQSDHNDGLANKISEIQKQLIDTINQAEMFTRAAYFDQNQIKPTVKTIKEGGKKVSRLMTNDDFEKQIMDSMSPDKLSGASTMPNTISIGIRKQVGYHLKNHLSH